MGSNYVHGFNLFIGHMRVICTEHYAAHALEQMGLSGAAF